MILNIFCKKHPKYAAKRAPQKPKIGDSCHTCWILYFLSGNSYLGEREVGVKQQGLACHPEGVLIAKEVE